MSSFTEIYVHKIQDATNEERGGKKNGTDIDSTGK